MDFINEINKFSYKFVVYSMLIVIFVIGIPSWFCYIPFYESLLLSLLITTPIIAIAWIAKFCKLSIIIVPIALFYLAICFMGNRPIALWGLSKGNECKFLRENEVSQRVLNELGGEKVISNDDIITFTKDTIKESWFNSFKETGQPANWQDFDEEWRDFETWFYSHTYPRNGNPSLPTYYGSEKEILARLGKQEFHYP